MSKRHYEIILSGIGGQGTVSSGAVLGEAASSYDNKFAVMSCVYGVAARGGFAKSDILIGTEFIPYFEARRPDVILVLANEAYPKIKNYIIEDTLVVMNSDEVTDYDRGLGKIRAFPFSGMAFELNSLQAVNMIALAFIVERTGIVSKEALIEAVKHKYPGENEISVNMKALERGFKLGLVEK